MQPNLGDSLYQILTIIDKELKIKRRFIWRFIASIIKPLLGFIIPYLIFMRLFEAIGNESFGIWNPENFIIFILTGLFVVYVIRLVEAYGRYLLEEKFWKTLAGLFLSPVSIGTYLFGIFLAEMVVLSIPLTIILILVFLVTNVSIISILISALIFFLGCVFLAGIGIAIGGYRLSKEGEFTIYLTIIKFFIIFSCYRYPREFFPDDLQFLIEMNPFFYYWELIRYILVFDYDILFNLNFLLHILIILSTSIITPVFSVIFFKYLFKKYGITGY